MANRVLLPRGAGPMAASAVIFVLLAAAPLPALAHKMYVFAEADGSTIRGEAYFRGGTPARDLPVVALNPAGEEIGSATTDADGKFVLEAKTRCEHRIVVKTPDGHGAEYTVTAELLPAELPEPGEAPTSQEPPETTSDPPEDDAAAAKRPDSQPESDSEELASLRRELASLRREVEQLRKRETDCQRQIRKSQDQTRLRDILGGVGWILGLGGIGFYVLGLRKKKRERAGDGEGVT